MKLLAFGQGQFAFCAAVPEIEFHGDDRHALLLGLDFQTLNLTLIEKKLPFPERVVIARSPGLVFRNVAVYQPSLTGANFGIGVAKGCLPFPETLDLGADENEAGFELIEQVIVVGGGAVLGNNLDALLDRFLGVSFHGATIISVERNLRQGRQFQGTLHVLH